jgi:hypothetical protein
VTELRPEDLGEIRDAIVAGYNHDTLNDLLRFNWGLKLADEFNVNDGVRKLASQLLDYAEREGRVIELVALAYSKKPNNPKLQAAATKFLDNPAAAIAKYDPATPPPPLPGSLEALVNRRSKLFNYGEFLSRVKSLGSRICRIDVEQPRGTGWLVGASHVLTNYHVMEPAIDGGVPVDQFACRFDLWSETTAPGPPAGTTVGVDCIVEKKRYSQSDLTGSGSPTEDELDYALIKLAEPVGSSPSPDGGQRGWFEIGPSAPIVARGDVAMIPQHASGRPLEVAYGTVVEFPASGLRYRYDVTTEPGSSGSPVLTPDLNAFGLHHAAEPEYHPTYNQAVPLWRIARDLQSKQIDWTG